MITIANGVPNIKTGAAIMTAYAKKWNDLYWAKDIIPDITRSGFFDEMQYGDEVDVSNEPVVPFHDYALGQQCTPDRINLLPTVLKIDQAGFFDVVLNSVDAKLSHLDLGNKYQEGGQKSGKKYIDQKFFAAMVDVADSHNKGSHAGINSSPLSLSGGFDLGLAGAGYAINTTSIVKFITSLQTVLQEQVAAESETWCAIPPWMHWCFINSELKSASMMGDDKSMIRDGFIGKLNGMKFYVNTYLSGDGSAAASPTAILAGNMEAINFSLRMVEAKRWENDSFEKLIQALMIWGWKAVKPQGVVNAYCYRANEV